MSARTSRKQFSDLIVCHSHKFFLISSYDYDLNFDRFQRSTPFFGDRYEYYVI